MLASVASAAHAQTATITGRVTEAAGGNPVQAAQVFLVGTTIGQLTGQDGRYTLRGVPAGEHRVRVLRVGYSEQVKPVTVTAGQTATVDFQLAQVSVQLAPVVTTATGEQRRVEVGNDIPNINAAKVAETQVITNMGDLLGGRAPGVQVLNGGTTGAGTRVRIRGTTSLSLSNEPIYVIDGVRMESNPNSTAISVGGTTRSRVNDIDPEDIENIEIVKGPSAATLYGADAANGVVVITTKKGRAGPARWTVHGEGGSVTDRYDYPANWSGWGRLGSTSTNRCFVWLVAAGSCSLDSVTTFNVLNNPNTTIIKPGYREAYGAQVTGGSEAVRYFLSGDIDNETGRIGLPDFEQARYNAAGTPISDFMQRPNWQGKKNGRANLNASVNPKLDLGTSIGVMRINYRNSQLDNNLFSPFAQALFGPGTQNTGTNTPDPPGGAKNGYLNFSPGYSFEENVNQNVNRFINASNLNYRPLSWLAVRANLGFDFTGREDDDTCLFQTCPNNGTTRQGFRTVVRRDISQYTADASATASWQPLATLSAKTTVGGQYFANRYAQNLSSGTTLPPGAQTAGQAATQTASEATSEVRTVGGFVEEALALRDRLFLTAAARADKNSASGANFKGVLYPKASLSWLISEEGFFPQFGWLNSFRLRFAAGESGNRPGTTDALQFFGTTKQRLSGTDVSGLTLTAPGNQNLKPETTIEEEGGFDATIINNRVNLQLTYYNKDSRDALISRILPPSFGTGNTSRFENLGKVRNWGWEWVVQTQILQGNMLGWDINVNGSQNSNKLVSLGGVPPIIGATISQKEGYPLNGWWVRPILSYQDKNGNGVIESGEVVVGDTAVFRGYSQPRTEIGLTNGFDFWKRRLRVQAQFDYRGGFKVQNGTERFKCNNGYNCRGDYDKTAPLFEQARAYALIADPSLTLDGFIEDANFLRFRELSVTLNAPDNWASRLRVKNLGATFSARNLKHWSKYTGLDPESNYGTGDVQNDFLTMPPATYYVFRINLGF